MYTIILGIKSKEKVNSARLTRFLYVTWVFVFVSTGYGKWKVEH
jgi:hypothetical protein